MLDFTLAKKRSGICIISLLLVITLFLTGCDVFAGTRPFDYPNSVWICEEPYVEIRIDATKGATAYLGRGMDRQELELLFDYGAGVEAIKAGTQIISEETILFQGDCIFGKKSFTIFLIKDHLWDGKYGELHFDRIS